MYHVNSSRLSDVNVESGVSVVGSPLVGSAVASSGRVVRSGKLNRFNNHVIHCNSELLLLPIYLGCYLGFLLRSLVRLFDLVNLFVSFQWRFRALLIRRLTIFVKHQVFIVLDSSVSFLVKTSFFHRFK